MLYLVPLFALPLAGARPLRIPGVYQWIGGFLLVVIVAAAASLAGVWRGARSDSASRLRLAGMLLIVPIAAIATLWVGLGTPWDATPTENLMRYAVLLGGAVAVTCGFAVLAEALREAGEREFTPLAASSSLLSGAAYVVWSAFQMGDFALRISAGEPSPAIAEMNNVFDALLFAASALAYLATAVFGHALARAGWLVRSVARAVVALSALSLALLLLRGVSFPSPTSAPAPWYTRPGFVVGIPALPWLVPYFLGVVALRRAGEESS